MELKARLKKGDPCIGSWISLAHPAIAEIMAKAGFHWLAVDLEHSVITIREAEELIRTINLCGVTPLVRLTSNHPDQIKRVMDAGSHGVIVPMVNNREQAEKAVQAIRYPPFGTRGVGLARAQGYGSSFAKYQAWQAENAIVIVQIEHIEAVANLREILSVEGVNGFIVGPYDLTGSLGLPGQFDAPEYLQAMETIRTIARETGVPGGIHVVEPDTEALKRRIQEGYRFLAYSVDIRMLDHACRQGIEAVCSP